MGRVLLCLTSFDHVLKDGNSSPGQEKCHEGELGGVGGRGGGEEGEKPRCLCWLAVVVATTS